MPGQENGKPGRTRCGICANPQRAAIDAALFAHTTLSQITSRFPGTTKSALSRHRLAHVGGSLIRAVARVVSPPPTPAEVTVYENDLLARVDLIEADADELLAEARANQDTRGAIQANLARLAIARERRELMPPRGVEEAPVVISFSFEPIVRNSSPVLDVAIAEDVEAVVEQPDAQDEPSSEELREKIGTGKPGTESEPPPARMVPPFTATLSTFAPAQVRETPLRREGDDDV